MSLKNEKFYIVTPPELIDEAHQELLEILPLMKDMQGRPQIEKFKILEKEKGGIECEGDLVVALQLNHFLKIPSRILWRRLKIKAREAYQLESQIRKIPWGQWIEIGTKVALVISASESKINNEKKLAQMLATTLKKFEVVEKDKAQILIFIRQLQNEMTISLDLSGRHLHQRGLLRFRTEAPLRETLAAAALRWMTKEITLAEQERLTWLDPMAGSGTHGAEILGLNQISPRESMAYEYLLETPVLYKKGQWKSNWPVSVPSYQRLILSDKDSKAVEVLKKNFKQGVSIFQKDIFEVDSRKNFEIHADEKLFVIFNPPYNRRIEVSEGKGARESALHCAQVLNPDRIGFWIPQPDFKNFLIPSYELFGNHMLKNGGLSVVFAVFQRK